MNILTNTIILSTEEIKMSRYTKANQTIDDLKKKIMSINNNGDIDDALYEIYGNYAPKIIYKDLSKINFDMENIEYVGEFSTPGAEDLKPFEMLGEFPVAWVSAGGDWELPLIFVLYIGDKGELRAYIPKDGNAYDHAEKCAYGSEEDEEFMDNFDEDKDYVFNSKKLREDVKNRSKIKR